MSGERGFSLLEQLVATAAFAVAATISLALFDSARKTFAAADNVAESQQAVRAALHRLTADLRMAGLNVNPDGDPARPDESIEAAYDTAVVIRGDFDGRDPAASATPESDLGGGAFATVSSGNDEVVAYVLAKPDGSSTGVLIFESDLADAPRDGIVETIRIPEVALLQNDPPYTLYRITFNDPGEFGGSRFVVRAPLIDQVERMTFRYYDESGARVAASDPDDLSDDLGGGEADGARRRRAAIRGVEVELRGVTRDADLRSFDPAGTRTPTRSPARFELTGFVTPRNIGRTGRRDPESGSVEP